MEESPEECVRRVARLARIALEPDDVPAYVAEFERMRAFWAALGDLDLTDCEPMTAVRPMIMRMRPDEVTDGDLAADLLRNAPERDGSFFAVPKVIE